MKALHFETKINAPVSKVYDTMLHKDTFKKWTAEFNPTSRYKGSWDIGSGILFLADGENGQVNGMVSRIKENKLNEFVCIEHLGILEGGKEITKGEKVDGIAGALEEYTFIKTDQGTLLKVSMDTAPEWEEYFEKTWPKALAALKRICE